MTSKNIGILGGVTALFVLLALVFSGAESDRQPEQGPLFPTLAEDAQEISEIRLDGEESTVLSFADGTWRVASRGGYPADSEAIIKLIGALIKVERTDPRTDNAGYYDRLGLGAAARNISLLDASGRQLATLAVGDRQFSDGSPKTFVRRGDEAQVWRVEGLSEIKTDAGEWFDDLVIDLDRNRLAALNVAPAEGEGYRISRPSPADQFHMEDMRSDEGVDQTVLTSVTSAPLYMTFDDVALADSLVEGATSRAVWHFFNGLVIRASLIAAPGEDAEPAYWLTLKAEAAEPIVIGPVPEDGHTADDGHDHEPALDEGRDPAAEAAELNARWAGWAYQLPAYKAEDLIKPRDDLIAASEEE